MPTARGNPQIGFTTTVPAFGGSYAGIVGLIKSLFGKLKNKILGRS